jgi:hypothetical protein
MEPEVPTSLMPVSVIWRDPDVLKHTHFLTTSFRKTLSFLSAFQVATVCLSGELTRPWSRDVMLNAVLKTLPLTKNVPVVGTICMIFDAMDMFPVTWYTKFYTNYEILKMQEWDETLES